MSKRITGKFVEKGFKLHNAHKKHRCHWCKCLIDIGWRFYRRSSIYKFHSDECVQQWLNHLELKKQGLVALSRVDRECRNCKKPLPKGTYYWYTRSNVFCSRECKDIISRLKKPITKYGTALCEVCETEFPKRTKDHRVCSARCYRRKSSVMLSQLAKYNKPRQPKPK